MDEHSQKHNVHGPFVYFFINTIIMPGPYHHRSANFEVSWCQDNGNIMATMPGGAFRKQLYYQMKIFFRYSSTLILAVIVSHARSFYKFENVPVLVSCEMARAFGIVKPWYNEHRYNKLLDHHHHRNNDNKLLDINEVNENCPTAITVQDTHA